MGEMQGSMWTTFLFIILFTGMTTMLFWAMDIMRFNSTVLTIEDNIKAENLDVFKDLPDRFQPCGVIYDTNTDCSGIIDIDPDRRIVTYQVSYDGYLMSVDAGNTIDSIVMLPY